MRIAIFCGSSSGNHPEFKKATRLLGKHFAENAIDIVYDGGKVYGVIPEHLKDKEIAHQTLTELNVVADMHQRKARMADMADAFVALPGGAGTLEEIFEAWTWAQLGHHKKPCAFYDINGFYNSLIGMISNMSKSGFLSAEYAEMLIHTSQPAELISSINAYQAPIQKWD